MSTFTDRSIKSSDITPKEVFEGRRKLIKAAAAGGVGLATTSWFFREVLATSTAAQKLQVSINPPLHQMKA